MNHPTNTATATATATAATTTAWHALSASEALARSGVDGRAGLSADEVLARQARFGANALPEPPGRPWWLVVGRQFKSPLIYILFAAAALALLLGHHTDALVILAVVLVNAVIGALQEGRAERSMAALRRLAGAQVRVQRNGVEQVLPAHELVPGDILLLTAGDAVAADARLLEQAQLQVAEAALTGESLPVQKSTADLPADTELAERCNMLYSGTQVTAGRARALVVATGAGTEIGTIAGLTERAQEPQTPLEQRLARFGQALVWAALGLFVLVLLLGLARGMPLPELLMVALSQMVSMVPEGLPVALTIALAVGMQRMVAKGVVIRRLSAVETLGSTTVICSDKTGTLTRNEMTVVALWLPACPGSAQSQPGTGRDISVSGIGYAPQGQLSAQGAELVVEGEAELQALLRAAALCNDAELVPPADAEAAWAVLGDPTEAALLVLARKAGLDLAALRSDMPRQAELPFDADTKLMATGHRLASGGDCVWVKGAPEAVLRLCGGDQTLAHAAAEALAARALRVLAFAMLDDGPLNPQGGFEALAGRVRLLGLVGQIDPPRDEVKAAVAACREAGIRPVMVTGDHPLTGLAIATELGIARPGDLAISGAELQAMDEPGLMAKLARVSVFARVQPAQKLRIVTALQASGEVVAMTGDGVNDAPALARADVGVAMGITGTEVAKGAARIVITDDNFATIVAAVEQGRVVYANVRKVILYLLATSLAEVLVLLLALLSGLPLPLLAVQILWINIVTEGTVTVNLVLDPPDGREMQRPPVPRNDRLLNRQLLWRVALMTPVIAAVTFGWFAWRLAQGVDETLVRTETFTVLAMCQWFNVLNCGSATASALRLGQRHNPWLMGGLALSVLLQGLVLYVPAMNALFHTQALPLDTLLALTLLASSVLWAEELRKFVLRRKVARRQSMGGQMTRSAS